jgi:hypothetical protein
MTTQTANARPTHRIFAVTKNGNKKFWQPIGALWPHGDGKGFNQKLDYPPLNGAEISSARSARIRKPRTTGALVERPFPPREGAARHRRAPAHCGALAECLSQCVRGRM